MSRDQGPNDLPAPTDGGDWLAMDLVFSVAIVAVVIVVSTIVFAALIVLSCAAIVKFIS